MSVSSLRGMITRLVHRQGVPAEIPTLLPLYIPIEEERRHGYKPEQFYPVKIGEVFNNTYQIACKIGFGARSTVWLARDLRRWRWQSGRFIALKVCSNDRTDQVSAHHEVELSRLISTANPSHPGLQHVRTAVDSFEVKGPHGVHMCLAYKPMREPIWLLQRRFYDGKYSPGLLRETLKPLLLALDYLHTECHIIHTDISLKNILIRLESESVLDVVAEDGVVDPSPRKIIADREIYLSRNDFGHPKASPGTPVVSDFDVAVKGDLAELHTWLAQPERYRAPEVTLGVPWTYSVDIWNLGVLLWDLIEGKPLCDGVDPQTKRYTSRAHLAQLTGLLGPPPRELLDRGSRTTLHFDADGRFKGDHLVPENFKLADSISYFEGDEKAGFLEFAGKMLQWLPENRKTAKELLEDPWFNEDD